MSESLTDTISKTITTPEDTRVNRSVQLKFQDSFPRRPREPNKKPFPLHLPRQKIAMISLAHKHHIVTSELPAFIVCGLFETLESAKSHAKFLHEKGFQYPLFSVNLFEFIPIEQKPSNNDEETAIKREAVLKAYSKTVQSNKQAFETRIKNRMNLKDLTEVKKDFVKMANEEYYRSQKTLQGPEIHQEYMANQVSLQRFMAVTVVLDESVEKNHCFQIYAAFERVEDCRRYISDTLMDYKPVQKYDVFCVDMYVWIHPDTVRLDSLNSIPTDYYKQLMHENMENLKSQSDQVKMYETECEEAGKALCETIATYDEQSGACVTIANQVDQVEELQIPDESGDKNSSRATR
jgi:hypothetical protein